MRVIPTWLWVVGAVVLALGIFLLGAALAQFPYMTVVTFIPDLVVALISAGLIAAIVLLVERRIHRQLEREAALEHWDRVGPKMSLALRQQMFWPGWSNEKTPAELTALFPIFATLADTHPLARWARAVPDNPKIVATGELADAFWEYAEAATLVEAKFASSQGWDRSNQYPLTQAFETNTLEALKSDEDYPLAWDVYRSDAAAECQRRWRTLKERWTLTQNAFQVEYVS
ncbi:UNVERIFIED_CONTAM: hypothetical protein OHV15_07975 [Microbacterium sp. SLM126]